MTFRPTVLLLALAGTVLLAAPVRADPVQRVEAKRVCMVNDTVFPKDQIPVQVSGKTYFGCCEMCKGRLTDDASARQAIDPVSKKPVDKATAVIGAGADGKVFYFENAANLERFNTGRAGS